MRYTAERCNEEQLAMLDMLECIVLVIVSAGTLIEIGYWAYRFWRRLNGPLEL